LPQARSSRTSVPCVGRICSMKITQDVREYAPPGPQRRRGIERGLEENLASLSRKVPEVYAKA
jgi:hypothetical protein